MYMRPNTDATVVTRTPNGRDDYGKQKFTESTVEIPAFVIEGLDINRGQDRYAEYDYDARLVTIGDDTEIDGGSLVILSDGRRFRVVGIVDNSAPSSFVGSMARSGARIALLSRKDV